MPHTRGRPSIHYTVLGEGPPLLLHHGFSSSGRVWEDFGYAEALGRGRMLVMLDARGHGASDKPHDPASYSIAHRVADVLAVLDDLGVERADFVGYSMGGWIGFGLLALAPERVGRAVLGGAHPYADDSWKGTFDPDDPAGFIRDFEAAIGDGLPPETHPMILANDLRALAASVGARPSLEHALGATRSPTLLYAGEREARLEKIGRAAAEIRGARLAVIPGLGHVDAYLRADMVTPYLAAFLGG